MSSGGIFSLREPKDLLAKLRHDMQRLEDNWLNEYAAFDFFITAHHIADWLNAAGRTTEGEQHEAAGALLKEICRQIANGSKHFYRNRWDDPAVSGTELHHGQFSQQFSEQFDISRLEISLEGEAAKQLGARITAPTLARQVLAFWEAHPDLR